MIFLQVTGVLAFWLLVGFCAIIACGIWGGKL